jgi:hypothetical protein
VGVPDSFEPLPEVFQGGGLLTGNLDLHRFDAPDELVALFVLRVGRKGSVLVDACVLYVGLVELLGGLVLYLDLGGAEGLLVVVGDGPDDEFAH